MSTQLHGPTVEACALWHEDQAAKHDKLQSESSPEFKGRMHYSHGGLAKDHRRNADAIRALVGKKACLCGRAIDFNGCAPRETLICGCGRGHVVPDGNTHRGWSISHVYPPIPIRSLDWSATSPDYDASYEGPEDGWVSSGHQVHAATREALIAEIDAWFKENEA